MMRGKRIAVSLLALLLLTGPAAMGQKRCKGTKKWYSGKCLYPGEIKKLKARARKKRAQRRSKRTRGKPGRAGISWVRSRPAGLSFSKSEVTVGQYRSCVNGGACKKGTFDTKSNNKNCNWGHSGRDDHPMNCVDWHGATAFCGWAGGRLPTKEEWYAEASNRGTRKYPWGGQKATCARAVMDDGQTKGSAGSETDGCGEDRTWPVCSKKAGNSVSGLCDMSGNVWEWTSTAAGSARVLRGGGWSSFFLQDFLRSSARYDFNPSVRFFSLGFRCARSSH